MQETQLTINNTKFDINLIKAIIRYYLGNKAYISENNNNAITVIYDTFSSMIKINYECKKGSYKFDINLKVDPLTGAITPVAYY